MERISEISDIVKQIDVAIVETIKVRHKNGISREQFDTINIVVGNLLQIREKLLREYSYLFFLNDINANSVKRGRF
jgi:hypothetical protein